jgi:periplasmic protein TonB
MFETVAPETFQTRSRKVFYETLPLSVALHALAIGAAVVIASWNIVFPAHSPKLFSAYSLATIPEPPPPPPLPPAGQPTPVQPAPPVSEAALNVAPTVIPDTIPTIPDPPPPSLQLLAPAPAAAPSAGVASGSSDGVPGGELGGSLQGITGGIVFPDDGKVHIGLNESLPLLPISQDYPLYPEDMRKKGIEDQVIVRYTIGKNGRVTDVQILSHATNAIFDTVTVDAISRWRFRPMIKNGKAVEVVHDLGVNFELMNH